MVWFCFVFFSVKLAKTGKTQKAVNSFLSPRLGGRAQKPHRSLNYALVSFQCCSKKITLWGRGVVEGGNCHFGVCNLKFPLNGI